MLLRLQPESLQNRFFLLETQLLTLFIITGIFFVNGILYGKQAVTVLDSLYCRQAVVALVTIHFQIPMITFQKLLCILEDQEIRRNIWRLRNII